MSQTKFDSWYINSCSQTHHMGQLQPWCTKHKQHSSNTLTAHKVSEVVFQAKPRTKSFRWTGSALATLLISSAIEGYWDPLQATTCKQTHMQRSITQHTIRTKHIWPPFHTTQTQYFRHRPWTRFYMETHTHKREAQILKQCIFFTYCIIFNLNSTTKRLSIKIIHSFIQI